MADEKKVSKTTLKTASKYIERMKRGEKIIRDSAGRIQWGSGRPVGRKTLTFMMEHGLVGPLDTDLFGDPSRGQTIGLVG